MMEHANEDGLRLPARAPDGHKGTFGTVLVVAGSAGGVRMIGAAVLSAVAAARAGAGLVRVLAAEPIAGAVLTGAPHATALAVPVDADGQMREQEAVQAFDAAVARCSAVVIGPGMGTAEVVERLAMRAAGQAEAPVVVDADALNALAAVPDLGREIRGRVILTPHPGEFRRLAGPLGIRPDPTKPEERQEAAGELARRLGCIVVLKGAGTVVSDGHRVWVCGRGHACMATGGTGDVLSGLLGGLVAQFPPPAVVVPGRAMPEPSLFTLACVAVEAHARAGEAWASASGASGGMLPGELADLLPAQLEGLRERSTEKPKTSGRA